MRPAPTLVAVLLLALACGPEAAREPPAAPRANVLLIVLDTLRTDHLSAYGYAQPTSRHLERLAAEGVLFEDCLAQASWTLPSMISLMTGQPIFSTIYRVPEAVPMLAEHFERAGYRTGAFVANSLVGAEAGFDRGVRQFEAREKFTRHWKWGDVVTRALAFLDGAPHDAGTSAAPDASPARSAPPANDAPPDDAPFFLWLHFLDTHRPYTPARPDPPRAVHEVLGEPELAAVRAVLDGLPEAQAVELRRQLPQLAEEVQLYDAELRELDAALGHLLRELEARGLHETTYVIVAADHGETLGTRPQHPDRLQVLAGVRADAGEPLTLLDHVKLEHDGWLFDELVRTPLILRGPGLPAGLRVPSLVTNLDILPTALGLAGLPVPRGPGRDLSPWLRDGAAVPPADFAVSASSGALAARTAEGRKLVLYPERLRRDHGLADALYDLAADPHEQQPLPLDDAARELAARLREAAASDPFLSFYDAPDDETLQALRELGYVR